jgi:PKD repeat protein
LTKNISIYSVPQPDFAIEAPPLSCANYPSQFDNNTAALTDSNITSWLWNFGDAANGSSAQQSPSYTYSSAANYNVSLTAISNFGCTATTQKAITILPSPQAAFNFSPACVNQNTQFTDASTGTVTSYQWNIQNNPFTTRNPQYIFSTSGNYPITFTVTASNGCKSQIVKTITVPVPPTVDFSTQAPCTKNATTFQELYPNGSDPTVTWSWNFGQGSGSGSPVSHEFPAEGTYTITLNTTRQSGCVYSASKNISISTGSTADFTPSVEAGAAPLNVTFNNNSTATSYLWNFGDANNSTSTAISPTFTYTSLGSYKALLTASNSLGCSDTLSAWINVVIPHIDLVMDNFSLLNNSSSNSSEVIVSISNAGNIPMINPAIDINLGGNASVKENLMGTIRPGTSYQQTLNLGIVTQSLNYICIDVEATDDVDFANNKLCETLTNNDVVQTPYPNPAKEQVHFDWISSSQENVRVIIYTSTGEVVFEQTFDSVQEGLNQLSINTSSLSSGLYLIQFNGSKTSKTFKIVVAN